MSRAFLKHDLRTLALNPGTPVFLSFAWAAAALLAFYAGGFFMGNEASAVTLFGYLPWVFALMLPALTMGLWAEDWRKGTAERLFTLPIPPLALSATRFIMLWLVVGLFLLGTWPFVATLFWLGSPALGPLFTGYVGAWLLGGTLLSAMLMVSALSRSFVTAFVGGLMLALLLLFSGWSAGLAWLSAYAPEWFVNLLREASLMEHYRTFILGQLNARSVVYFAALMALFQVATHMALARRLELTRTRTAQLTGWLAMAVMLAVAALAMAIPGRVDMTPEKLYTLAPQTKELLRQLPPGTELLVYSSESNPAVPQPVRRLHRRLMDLLADFNKVAPHLSTRIINTDSGLAAELAATEDGMVEQTLGTDDGYYFGLVLNLMGRKVGIGSLAPEREPYLEFDLASLMASALKTKNKVLGVILVPELANQTNRPPFLTDLEHLYQIRLLRPGVPDVPEDVAVLIVMPAPYYPEETLYAINKYLMKGGRMMVFLDPYYRSHPEDFPNLPDRNADAFRNDHAADILRTYGITYPGQEIVADSYLATRVEQEGVGSTTYPMWLTLGRNNINAGLPFTGFVDTVTLAESGHFTISPTEGVTVEPILTTSPEGQLLGRTLMDATDPQLVYSQVRSPRAQRTLAVLATGRFPNMYPQQPGSVTRFYQDFSTQAPDNAKFIPPHVAAPQGEKEGAIIAIADMDFMAPDFAFRDIPGPDGEPVAQAANDNVVMFFNMLQWLAQEGDLLGLRGKGTAPRRFTRVQGMMETKTLLAQRKEQDFATELYQVSNRLAQLKARNQQGNESELNEAAIKELATVSRREFTLKANLRQIRRDLRNDILRTGHLLALFNALTMPLLTLAAFAVYRKSRRRKPKSEA